MEHVDFYMVKGEGPTSHKHSTLERAMAEAERLAHRHHGQGFTVLASISTVEVHQLTKWSGVDMDKRPKQEYIEKQFRAKITPGEFTVIGGPYEPKRKPQSKADARRVHQETMKYIMSLIPDANMVETIAYNSILKECRNLIELIDAEEKPDFKCGDEVRHAETGKRGELRAMYAKDGHWAVSTAQGMEDWAPGVIQQDNHRYGIDMAKPTSTTEAIMADPMFKIVPRELQPGDQVRHKRRCDVRAQIVAGCTCGEHWKVAEIGTESTELWRKVDTLPEPTDVDPQCTHPNAYYDHIARQGKCGTCGRRWEKADYLVWKFDQKQ